MTETGTTRNTSIGGGQDQDGGAVSGGANFSPAAGGEIGAGEFVTGGIVTGGIVTGGIVTGVTGASLVYTTVPSMEAAETLARALVEARLAACVNMIPGVVSVYAWQGATNVEPEVIVLIKTRRERVSHVMAAIRSAHPYDTPALVGYDIAAGSVSYLDWLMAQTDPSTDPCPTAL